MSVVPAAYFNKREQKESFFQWMRDHPSGYVLNWPCNGITASSNVRFHRSGCRVLLRRSFPTEAWHKVCTLQMSQLVTWAKEKRRFEDSSAVHACIVCFPGGESEFETAASEFNFQSGSPAAVDAVVPERVATTVLRIVRDTALARRIKSLHKGKCQLCGAAIDLPGGGRYAEAHHLQPLGKPHDGPDHEGNIVCVCPTCHAKLDYGVVQLRFEELRCVKGHQVSREFLDYHNRTVYRGKRPEDQTC